MSTKKNFTVLKQTLNKTMCEQLMSCIKYFILQQSFQKVFFFNYKLFFVDNNPVAKLVCVSIF